MLRGTNRSIIEINETENQYFEKALLFVKPEYINLSPERLNREALRMIGALTFSPVGLGRQGTARKRAAEKRRRRIFICGLLFLITAFVFWKLI